MNLEVKQLKDQIASLETLVRMKEVRRLSLQAFCSTQRQFLKSIFSKCDVAATTMCGKTTMTGPHSDIAQMAYDGVFAKEMPSEIRRIEILEEIAKEAETRPGFESLTKLLKELK